MRMHQNNGEPNNSEPKFMETRTNSEPNKFGEPKIIVNQNFRCTKNADQPKKVVNQNFR